MDSQTPETIRETGVLGRLFRLQALRYHCTNRSYRRYKSTFLTMVYIILLTRKSLGAALDGYTGCLLTTSV